MYIILGIIMLLRGFADALMMRRSRRWPSAAPKAICRAHHYDQVFTAHGVIMIFFVAMPLVTGLMNFVMPLQIGARDVAFPFLNNLSFWMTVGRRRAGHDLAVRRRVRRAPAGSPIRRSSGIAYSPDVGRRLLHLGSLQIAGIGTTLSGINLIATIIKMRAPGMTMMKMPVFCWTALCTNILIVAIFPVLTATLVLLSLDRYVGTNFFTNDLRRQPDDVL